MDDLHLLDGRYVRALANGQLPVLQPATLCGVEGFVVTLVDGVAPPASLCSACAVIHAAEAAAGRGDRG